MSYPPSEPPGRPDQTAPPFQHNPPRPKNRRGLVIGLISAAAALVLCLGVGCTGLVIYYLRLGTTDDASSGPGDERTPSVEPPDPQESRPSSPLPSRCGVTIPSPQPETRSVGVADFDSAPTSGTATMRITTNLGPIVIEMDRARTPCTVASFQHLATRKFFDQSRCHRLVTEGIFVLQCGDPSGTGRGGPDYHFTDENLAGARYTRGVVAMANAGPGTNGSQFFVIFRDSPLDPNYTPFGTVTAGLDVVDRVAAGGHDNSSEGGGGVPRIPISIQTLTVS